jgi:hypothetical protein
MTPPRVVVVSAMVFNAMTAFMTGHDFFAALLGGAGWVVALLQSSSLWAILDETKGEDEG